MPRSIKILFLAAEADPFIKVGGLGDVAGSLPGALRALSPQLDVRLCIPLHNDLKLDGFDIKPVSSYSIMRGGQRVPVQVFETIFAGTPVYLIEGSPISSAQSVYSADMAIDGEKYTFFSLAALELLRHIRWQPGIIHANDWHTAPAVYARGAILAGSPVGFPEPVHVDVVGERGNGHPRGLSRHFRYPLLFR